MNLSSESEAHKVHYLGAWYVLVREVKSHARYKIRRMVYTSIQPLKDGFNLYCQALGRLNFIVFSSQSKEFRRDFVEWAEGIVSVSNIKFSTSKVYFSLQNAGVWGLHSRPLPEDTS